MEYMNPYAGLLSQDEQSDARKNLLLNFGLGLLANSGPSTTPVSFGQAAGKAGLSAIEQQNQYSQGLVQNKFLKQKMEESERQRMLPELIGRPGGQVPMGPPTAQGEYGSVMQEGTGVVGGKIPSTTLYQNMLGMGPEYAKMGMHGLGVGADVPASVREYEYFNKLPKTAQDQFLGLKRQGYEVTNIAGVPTLVPRMPGGQVVPLSTLQNEMSGKAGIAGATKAATTLAEAQTEAKLGLGSSLDEIQKMRDSVKGLVESPGFDTIYGLSGKIDPRNYVPGTSASDASAKREQLDAMSFGIAIQKMKGLGALSDAEGKRVSAAYTRATNPKISSDEARKSWNEVLQHLDKAERRSVALAGGNINYAPGDGQSKTIKGMQPSSSRTQAQPGDLSYLWKRSSGTK